MNFAYSATKNMYPQLRVCIDILFSTQKSIDNIFCFVEDDPEYFNEKRHEIHFINVSKYAPIRENKMNSNSMWTYIVLTRCYFTELLPNVDKLLYLDLDTFPTRDLSPFYNVDMSENSIMGVEDIDIKRFHRYLDNSLENYLNSGVLLMNLKYMRDNNINKRLHYLLNNIKLDYPDQDALNIACQESLLVTDNRWNSSTATGVADKPFIIHTTGRIKPWMIESPLFKSWCSFYFHVEIK